MTFEMITTTAALERAVTRLTGEPFLACDLEADSQHHYLEQVCLLQIACPGQTYVVDPLACPDLSLLKPIFADPGVCKVFHGADYDVRSLHRDFGITMTNLFDTMIACQFLGEPEVGLAAVLKKRYGAELDKRYQQADWTRRPLSPEMLDYAVKDTSLLIPLYGQLSTELADKGRLEWVREECALLTQVRMAERGDEPLFLRFKGAAKMSPATLAVLEELLRFRDVEAQRRDVPLFKVLGAETLRELAERKPASAVELQGVSGLSSRLVERYGQGLLAAVARGTAVNPSRLPGYPHMARIRRTKAQEAQLKRLKLWREKKASELGMSPGLVANNALLESLVEGEKAASGTGAARISGLKNWQYAAFGEELAELLGSGD
ncbi:MAG: ribonuclease D [Geobacter sp.]|nr:ribonuclease D [Geobacter sp.]